MYAYKRVRNASHSSVGSRAAYSCPLVWSKVEV